VSRFIEYSPSVTINNYHTLKFTVIITHVKSHIMSSQTDFQFFSNYELLSPISHRQHTSQSYAMTDAQSVSLSWNKAPIWSLGPTFYFWQSVECLLMWGAHPDEKTGLSFTIAAGPRQHIHSRFRVPWDSRSYFTLSDSRLPFSLPPTTRRATVELFDPASTQDILELPYIAMARTTQNIPLLLRNLATIHGEPSSYICLAQTA
jgi:hypothetical protein